MVALPRQVHTFAASQATVCRRTARVQRIYEIGAGAFTINDRRPDVADGKVSQVVLRPTKNSTDNFFERRGQVSCCERQRLVQSVAGKLRCRLAIFLPL